MGTRTRSRWLPDEFTVSTATRNKSLRIKWPGGSNVSVYFYSKGKAKAQVNVQHMKLNKEGQSSMRTFWQEKLENLGRVLQ